MSVIVWFFQKSLSSLTREPSPKFRPLRSPSLPSSMFEMNEGAFNNNQAVDAGEKYFGDRPNVKSDLLITRLLKRPFLLAALVAGTLTIVAGIISAVLHSRPSNVVNSYSTGYWIGAQQAIVIFLSLAVLVFHSVSQARKERHAEEKNNHEYSANNADKAKDTGHTSIAEKPIRIPKWFPNIAKGVTVSDIVQTFLISLNLLSLVVAIIQLSVSSAFTDNSHSSGSAKRTRLMAPDIASIVLHTLFGIFACLIMWGPVIRAVRRCLYVCALFHFIIGTLILEINFREGTKESGPLGRYEPSGAIYSAMSFFIHVGSVEVGIALAMLGLTSVVNTSNRLSTIITRCVTFFVLASVIAVVLDLIYCALALVIFSGSFQTHISDSTVYANIILSWTTFILHLISLTATAFLQSRPESHLKVEVFDVNSLSAAQVKAFATLIDKFGKTVPGSPSGENAMSMLRSYAAVKMPGLKCRVLRVYKPTANSKDSLANIQNKAANMASQSVADYYTDKEFQNLDRQNVLPSDLELELETQSLRTLVSMVTQSGSGDKPKTLSKNQLKRMKKKAAVGKKRESVPFPLENPISKEEIRKEVEFNEKIMATEALVLLTCIDNYDLTTSSNSKFYRFLYKTLGGGSPIKFWRPLCVRLGLLGFHWPFRQATFYCSPTKRPVARSSAILRAITEWNKQLPSKEKCSIMLDPRYANDTSERAIEPSGWSRVPLPPSHIVDLRPYKGKSLNEYLKGVKYRNQNGTFEKADGEVIETTDFSEENCAEVLRLWKNIAEKRTGDGNTSVLADPTLELFETLGDRQINQHGDRSLLFLRVDGVNIASCVLFRLGDTITSDLQGLDHELARQYKAYFVMMQETIQIALKEGISFVDFGPTTAKPKLDIGCRSIPLIGGITTVSLILRCGLGMFAKNIELNN